MKRGTRPSKQVTREFLLAFWKIHILHHAEEAPVYGQWIVTELHEHGYQISPGTLYPLLSRMESNGWLKSRPGEKGRKEYRLTKEGGKVLTLLRRQLRELKLEVVKP
jgi:PadR family transcriptional regulator, regulatory protein PadR